MGHPLRRGAAVLVAGGACALVLVAILHPASPARRSAVRAAPGPGARDGDGDKVPDVEGSASQAIDPALFSQGSCMAFMPTQGDRHETVFLDAGHGGIDPGAIGSTQSGATIDEATADLAIELDTTALLRAQGYRVAVSRTQNTTVAKLSSADVSGGLLTPQGVVNDVAARDVCANKAGADILIGIYMDSGYPGNAG